MIILPYDDIADPMNGTKEGNSNADSEIECPRCGFMMAHIQTCHLRCNNCGAEMTCSDKGSVW